MTDFKGTPGKWKYSSTWGDIKTENGGLIAEVVVNGNEDENGALLAAAPELLELVSSANGPNGCHTVMWQEKAKSVLEKALGQ